MFGDRGAVAVAWIDGAALPEGVGSGSAGTDKDASAWDWITDAAAVSRRPEDP